jgi:phenylalanine-4-hydroxylase
MTLTPVELPADHPGCSDPAYRQRRQAIADRAGACSGASPPRIDYTADEHAVWQTVSAALRPLHEHLAVEEYRLGAAALELPVDRVPQLADVSNRLTELTGWRIEAVPGLVPTGRFYGALADKTFLSTQYVRHPSVPFYTPEPDIIHEVIGHANGLAAPRLAALYEAAGRASLRATSEEQLERFSRVFWFTMEFGVVREHGELRTYGAGLLSSFGEIQSFRNAEIRTFDLDEMATRAYDITRFQDVLYAAGSFDEIVDRLSRWFDRSWPTTTGSPDR